MQTNNYLDNDFVKEEDYFNSLVLEKNLERFCREKRRKNERLNKSKKRKLKSKAQKTWERKIYKSCNKRISV